jgi:UbiD family decarboxylase
MPFQDFREFLDALRNAGELLELEHPVSPELDVAKVMRKSASRLLRFSPDSSL